MSNERRVRPERRGHDLGPPGAYLERRQTVERRLPETMEAELSAEDFAKYFGPANKASGNTD